MPHRYLSSKADSCLQIVCDTLQKEHGAPVSRSGAIEAMFRHWETRGFKWYSVSKRPVWDEAKEPTGITPIARGRRQKL
jgi:hypothetical protein